MIWKITGTFIWDLCGLDMPLGIYSNQFCLWEHIVNVNSFIWLPVHTVVTHNTHINQIKCLVLAVWLTNYQGFYDFLKLKKYIYRYSSMSSETTACYSRTGSVYGIGKTKSLLLHPCLQLDVKCRHDVCHFSIAIYFYIKSSYIYSI